VGHFVTIWKPNPKSVRGKWPFENDMYGFLVVHRISNCFIWNNLKEHSSNNLAKPKQLARKFSDLFLKFLGSENFCWKEQAHVYYCEIQWLSGTSWIPEELASNSRITITIQKPDNFFSVF
jgi:hypothetical protein